jgi:hypothetical protein
LHTHRFTFGHVHVHVHVHLSCFLLCLGTEQWLCLHSPRAGAEGLKPPCLLAGGWHTLGCWLEFLPLLLLLLLPQSSCSARPILQTARVTVGTGWDWLRLTREPFWAIFRHLGSILEASWKHLGSILEASWKHLGSILVASWKRLGSILEASWEHLGSILEASWEHLERPPEALALDGPVPGLPPWGPGAVHLPRRRVLLWLPRAFCGGCAGVWSLARRWPGFPLARGLWLHLWPAPCQRPHVSAHTCVKHSLGHGAAREYRDFFHDEIRNFARWSICEATYRGRSGEAPLSPASRSRSRAAR